MIEQLLWHKCIQKFLYEHKQSFKRRFSNVCVFAPRWRSYSVSSPSVSGCLERMYSVSLRAAWATCWRGPSPGRCSPRRAVSRSSGWRSSPRTRRPWRGSCPTSTVPAWSPTERLSATIPRWRLIVSMDSFRLELHLFVSYPSSHVWVMAPWLTTRFINGFLLILEKNC